MSFVFANLSASVDVLALGPGGQWHRMDCTPPLAIVEFDLEMGLTVGYSLTGEGKKARDGGTPNLLLSLARNGYESPHCLRRGESPAAISDRVGLG